MTPSPSSDYVTQPSPWPVSETVQRFSDLLGARGITIFATIDQRAAAREVGLDLRETVLIVFGNPQAGTPVMDAVPLAALDLPLKLLIWDDGGQTQISYVSPDALVARNGIAAELAGPLGAPALLTGALLSSGA